MKRSGFIFFLLLLIFSGCEKVVTPEKSTMQSKVKNPKVSKSETKDPEKINEQTFEETSKLAETMENDYKPDEVRLGLYWLEDHQNEDGSWSADFHKNCGVVKRPIKRIEYRDFNEHEDKVIDYKMVRDGKCSNKEGSDDSGKYFSDELVTGLTLLAFMSCGYTHESGEFKSVIKEGLRSLMKTQHVDGCFASETDTYLMMTHAICTFAIVEAYSMTANAILKRHSQSALKYLVNSQCMDKDGNYTGWSKKDKKLIVDPMATSWAFLALKSCRIAALKVPEHCWEGIENYFKSITTVNEGVAKVQPTVDYMPKGSDKFEKMPIFEAVYALCQLYIGKNRTDELYKSLMQPLKNLKHWISDEDPKKIDFMYWYFDLNAMGQYMGKYYDRWESQKIDTLSRMQRNSDSDKGKCVYGSWDPVGVWGKAGGRVYSTALGFLVFSTWFRTWGVDYSSGASDDWEGISPRMKEPTKPREKTEAEKKAEEENWKESWGDW